MNTKYLKTLEYDKIIENLSKYCKTYIGKENASKLLPSFLKSNVLDLLNLTNEAISLIYRKSSLPLSSLPNISLYIKSLKSSSVLTNKPLLDIAKFLKISREVKEYFFDDEDFDFSNYAALEVYFDNLYTNKSIEDKIFNIVLDENTIADNASSTLFSLRKQSQKLEQSIRDKLNSLIHSNTYSKYLMEPIVTIRNDRYVIPVKEEYRTQVKGFMHDVSSSGSTVFIEPINVFELNNELSNIKAEEDIEIEKILANLSGILYDYTDKLTQNLNILGVLDLTFAKANYSIELNAVKPIINDEKIIDLKSARHPLISKNTVVPIDISIGKDYSSLVITGPNTGGKTVSLKTTGILLLMAYSGIFIPAKENSSIFVFDNIFADIGDEQSIQESLSTFSSHMSTIIEITNIATSNSLVLLDELGSGTDPIEGANLAISILKYFFDLGITTISTTHYQELKNYCLVTDGFENASCEFDLENLRPTYKLLIGIPGKSNAFAISKKLGLNDNILDYASSLMHEDNISIEEVMKNIYDDKIEIEKEKEKIKQNSTTIEDLRKELEKQNKNLQEKQNKILQNAKNEAKEILEEAKAEASSVINELKSLGKNDLSKANTLRNELNDNLKKVSNNSNSLNLDALKELNNKFSLKNNTLDNKKTGSKSHSSVTFSKGANMKSKNISSEINVIGMNVDEAIFVIDKYLDNCAIAKLSPIRIVHGKGTGKLREGIHKFLKTNPHVASFRLGTFGEGEMGVTVVELK